MPSTNPTPAGYRQNAQGHLIPERQIKSIDLLRDELVQEIVQRAKVERDGLKAFKASAFADIASFVALSVERYGVRLGGEKGNVQLMSFDGRYKIVRAHQDRIAFDEGLQAAKALIDECVREWTSDARAELVVIVQDAFRADSDGKIQTGRIMELRRYDIADERWLKAMEAIADAIKVVGSKSYIRLYERDANGRYLPISLDIAVV